MERKIYSHTNFFFPSPYLQLELTTPVDSSQTGACKQYSYLQLLTVTYTENWTSAKTFGNQGFQC